MSVEAANDQAWRGALRRHLVSVLVVAIGSASAGCVAPRADDHPASESDDLVAARIYDCRGEDVDATLYFTADERLKGATVRGTPYADGDWLLRRGFRELTGRNASAEYFHALWPVQSEGMDLSVELSFKTRARGAAGWNRLALDASLLGFDEIASGVHLGKLRLDIAAAEADVGSTFYLACTKTK